MSDQKIMKEFQKFGERFFIIAILVILSIFVEGLMIFAGIVALFALANIKKVNKELKDKNLKRFTYKIKKSVVVWIIAMIIIGVAAGVFYFIFMIEAHPIFYLIPINILIYGIILIYESIGAQRKAWLKLNKFFTKNESMFPKEIAADAMDGTDKLAKACKYAYFIITIPIAVIYGIIGLFKLANLRNIPVYSERAESTPPKVKLAPVEVPKPESIAKGRYCTSCGNKIERAGRFCALCGQDLMANVAHS